MTPAIPLYIFYMIFKIFYTKADKIHPPLIITIYFHDPVPAEDDGGRHGQGEEETELQLVFPQK